jgi:phosphoesterase RecJ-like protein
MPSDRLRFQEAAAALLGAHNIALVCHINPDGDALGSMLGLALALESLGKNVLRLCQDTVPLSYQFMAGAHLVADHPPADWAVDVSVGLDCDAEHRLGNLAPFILKAPKVVDLDHHTGSGPFGDIRVLESASSSTSQVVYDLLPFLGAPLTTEIATCLLTGIIFDTGAFRHSNTSASTFTAAAALVEAGAVPDLIHQRMFDDRPFSNVKLLGRALTNALTDGSVAWSALTRKDFRESGAAEAETEGVVNNLMAIRGINAAALFRETAHGIKVSLRSRNGIDVAAVARRFGGGGHVKAAGCTVEKPMAVAMAEVLALLKPAQSA